MKKKSFLTLFFTLQEPHFDPLHSGYLFDFSILDGVDFFLDYISSDLVGIIATRHLQIADQEYLGTLHPDCLKLAQLHSKAVDYPKTGYARLDCLFLLSLGSDIDPN